MADAQARAALEHVRQTALFPGAMPASLETGQYPRRHAPSRWISSRWRRGDSSTQSLCAVRTAKPSVAKQASATDAGVGPEGRAEALVVALMTQDQAVDQLVVRGAAATSARPSTVSVEEHDRIGGAAGLRQGPGSTPPRPGRAAPMP